MSLTMQEMNFDLRTNDIQTTATRALISFALVAAMAVVAEAAPVTTETQATNRGLFPQLTAATDDLIHQGAPSFVSMSLTAGTPQFFSDEQNLNDADMSDDDSHSNAFIPEYSPTSVLEIDLDLTNSAAGYDITQVVSHTGTDRDSNWRRMQQNYLFDVALVGDLGTWVPVFSTGTQIPDITNDNGQYQLSTVDSLADPLATGVGRIRVTFQNPGDITTYSNLDIFGQATAVAITSPEPSTAGLAMLALATCVFVRHRRRRVTESHGG